MAFHSQLIDIAGDVGAGLGNALASIPEIQRQQRLDDLARRHAQQQLDMAKQQMGIEQQQFQQKQGMNRVNEMRSRAGRLMDDRQYDQAAAINNSPDYAQALQQAGLPAPTIIKPGTQQVTTPVDQTPETTGATINRPAADGGPVTFGGSAGGLETKTFPTYNTPATVSTLDASLLHEPEKPIIMEPGAAAITREGKVLYEAPNPYKQTAAQQQADFDKHMETLMALGQLKSGTSITIQGMRDTASNNRANAGPKGRLVQDPTTGQWYVAAPGVVGGVHQAHQLTPAQQASQLDSAVAKRYPLTQMERMTGQQDPALQMQRLSYRNNLLRQAHTAAAAGTLPPSGSAAQTPQGAVDPNWIQQNLGAKPPRRPGQ